jgi:hypothetical protein
LGVYWINRTKTNSLKFEGRNSNEKKIWKMALFNSSGHLNPITPLWFIMGSIQSPSTTRPEAYDEFGRDTGKGKNEEF